MHSATSPPRIIEVDESQHFNCYRGKTLGLYPAELQLAFDRKTWLTARRPSHCKSQEGGQHGNLPSFPTREAATCSEHFAMR
jgi:hypothetical protein